MYVCHRFLFALKSVVIPPHHIEHDIKGLPIFPIILGPLSICALGVYMYVCMYVYVCCMYLCMYVVMYGCIGTINQKSRYHTIRHIFPVGYTSERLYKSLAKPGEECVYRSEILVSTYSHTHTHTYIHTYIHTCMRNKCSVKSF